MPLSPTMRRDVTSAYGASAARIASWVIVSAIVYRRFGADAFALLTLVRSTVGLLAYSAWGLGPAMISRLASASAPPLIVTAIEDEAPSPILPYASPPTVTPRTVYSSAMWMILLIALGATFLAGSYSVGFKAIHNPPPEYGNAYFLFFFAFAMCLGVVARVMGEVPGAVLQTNNRIALDNTFVACAELLWALMAIGYSEDLRDIALAFLFANLLLTLARFISASGVLGLPTLRECNWHVAIDLLVFGSLVVLAQLADYLYAPTDYILINRLLSAKELATYAPAVQIDSGLLLLVSGLAAVLLPRAAIAHANENRAALRRYYFVGTLASLATLLVAGAFAWIVSPWLFKVWFGNTMPGTREILPLVLICTILGGSAMVGRSILLGMGKVAPFATAVLIAGVSNVLLSWLFVARFHLGLRGIILGTIAAVVGRSVIWMPWYVMRTLKKDISS